MVNCLKCKKELVLSIDADDFRFQCKNCGQEYKFTIIGKDAQLALDNKKLTFFLNSVSPCSKNNSKNALYELYNKGYVKCTKILNTRYNNNDNEWTLPVTDILNASMKNYNSYIKSLYDEIEKIEGSEQNYVCNSCRDLFSFEKAVNNNFVCTSCAEQLKEISSEERKQKIIKRIEFIKNHKTLLMKGWR